MQLVGLAQPNILPLLRQLQRGIEKEGLRVDRQGHLAQTPHPQALGSALTHACITTDYSEALLEFITSVHDTVDGVLAELEQIHQFTALELTDEVLWNASMPCRLGSDEDIPVAQYGSSNSARLKTIYRLGLGYRYGRHMQTIAGIHYNFSLPDALWPIVLGEAPTQAAVTAAYFGGIRNFRRYSWLLIYLFGASPALSRTFLDGQPHRLQELDEETLFAPYATSLRMGDLGYQSSAQEGLRINYNCVENYVETLVKGILEPYPDYQRIGLKVDGEYRQLSAGLLQIENEFYSTIRPKRVAARGETALSALARRGTQYIEVRCLDINPFLPLGIDDETIRFLDAFLLFCLLHGSPVCTDAGSRESRANIQRVVNEGRRPGVRLHNEGAEVGLTEWANELIDQIAPIAALLDQAHASDDHTRSLERQRERVANPELTPSAQLLKVLKEGGESFVAMALRQSEQHTAARRQRPIDRDWLATMEAAGVRSLAEQRQLEEQSQLPFDDYLRHYFEQYRAL